MRDPFDNLDWEEDRYPDRSLRGGRRGHRRISLNLQRIAASFALMIAGGMLFWFGYLAMKTFTSSGGKSDIADRHANNVPREAVKERTEPVNFTVVSTGDFLIHGPVYNQALRNGRGTYDFRPMFKLIKPLIKAADLPICHIETPMGAGQPSGNPIFNTPAQLADAIKATGWKLCDTASNHTLDKGEVGVRTTIAALNARGIRHTGSFNSERMQRTPTIVDVKGVKVAFMSYTEMTNGIPLPKPWSVNIAKTATILRDAKAARKAGADVVIVNIHGGNEYQHQPSNWQRTVAKAVLRSKDVTAVIGQHVHVVQTIEKLGRKYVVYGEGNLISNQSSVCCPAASQDGIIARLHFTVDSDGDRVTKVEYIPTMVDRSNFTVLPVGDALRKGIGNAAELRASYERTTKVIGRSSGVSPVPRSLLN